jgi:hypothetical protein
MPSIHCKKGHLLVEVVNWTMNLLGPGRRRFVRLLKRTLKKYLLMYLHRGFVGLSGKKYRLFWLSKTGGVMIGMSATGAKGATFLGMIGETRSPVRTIAGRWPTLRVTSAKLLNFRAGLLTRYERKVFTIYATCLLRIQEMGSLGNTSN